MSIPIGLSASQIQEFVDLVAQDMSEYLGYTVYVVDVSKKGEDIRPQLRGLDDEDFTSEVQRKYNVVCRDRFYQIAKLYGEQ